ncbi:MAG: hypothetical protein ACYC0B_07165 [Gemmatimonadaceae bacterium]
MAALFLVGGTVCGESPPTAPIEPVTEPLLPPTATVTGAVRAGETLTYSYEVPANSAVRFFLQGTSGSDTDSLVAIIRSDVGNIELGRVASKGTAPTARSNGFLIGAFPTTSRLVVEVGGARASDAGPFVLSAVPHDDGPEHGSDDLLRIGVRVSEQTDAPGDVDRFRLLVEAGQRVIVFVGKVGTPSNTLLQVTVSDGASVQTSVDWRGDHDIFERSIVLEPAVTTMFTIGFQLEVVVTASPWNTGTFEILPLVVPRAPESAPSIIARGDTVTEAMDVMGDIDEFTLATGASEDFRLALALDRDMPHPITLTVLRDGKVLTTMAVSTALTDSTSIVLSDQPATFTIRIAGATRGLRDEVLTSYRLSVIPLGRSPERVSALIVPGVAVRGEQIDHLGDIDDFEISLTQGQRFSVRTVGEVRAVLVDPANAVLGDLVMDWTLAPGFRATRGLGVAPSTGAYKVRLTGRAPGVQAYEFSFFLVDTLPETVPPVLPFNTWVTTEGLEVPADVDVFTIVAPPQGGIVNIITESGTVVGGDGLSRHYSADWRPSTDGRLAAVTGFRRLAPGEEATFSVSGTTWTSDLSSPGTYRIVLALIDSTPESVSAVLAAGDTVQGESIEPLGDIDEFSVIGAPGDSVRLRLDGSPAPASCFSFSLVNLEAFDGATLLRRQEPGYLYSAVKIPTSGVLRVVVSSSDPICGSGPYRLVVVTPVP